MIHKLIILIVNSGCWLVSFQQARQWSIIHLNENLSTPGLHIFNAELPGMKRVMFIRQRSMVKTIGMPPMVKMMVRKELSNIIEKSISMPV